MLVFLMCSERSGSNFIAKLMNGHPDIVGPSPKHIINPVARNLFRYGDLNDKKNWYELINDIYRLFSVGFSKWTLDLTLEKLHALGSDQKIETLIYNLFMEEAKLNSAKHVFIKENQLYEYMLFLTTYFKEAKYVYQVRDPRDMALSWKKNLTHKGGVVCGARQWKKDQMNFLKNYYVLNQMDKAYLLKYEDLIKDTKKYTSELCDFFGVLYSPAIQDFYKDELTVKNASNEAAWANLKRGVLTENSKKYIKDLSETEIMAIEKICYPEMNVLGYKPEYSFETLSELTDAKIDEMAAEEIASQNYQPRPETKENMEAKKVFYQKVID